MPKLTKDFGDYFTEHIDPDMNNMGAWVLKEKKNINLKMLTTNQAEILNAKIKRINMNKELPLELIA